MSIARITSLLLLVAAALMMGGCASTGDTHPDDRVSNIPWNRPERWEGQGPMGGMMNTR